MTVTATAPPAAPDDILTPTVRTTVRKSVFWVVAAVVALLGILISFLFIGANGAGAPFASDNAAPAGAEALTEVLKAQGVAVTATSSLDETRDAIDDPSTTTVMLYDPFSYLDRDAIDSLSTLANHFVIVEPDFNAIDQFLPEANFAGDPGSAKSLGPACDLPAATRAGSISTGTNSFALSSAGAASAAADGRSLFGCYADSDEGYQVVFSSVGSGADEGEAGSRSVALVADSVPFTNERIIEFGNASLALNLLGSEPNLIWYLPSIADLAGSPQPTLGDLTPEWVTPAIVLLLAVALAAAIWRGRRFGPIVVENLPVIVRSRETMEGRARLYQRASTRLRALDALRIGAVARIATALKLSRQATVDEVAIAAAAVTGQPLATIQQILLTANPANDRDLIELSDRLLALERAVRTALSETGAAPSAASSTSAPQNPSPSTSATQTPTATPPSDEKKP